MIVLGRLDFSTGIPYRPSVTSPRFDPRKDAINRAKHGLSLTFGDRIFEDPKHVLITSYRPLDGENRYKVIGVVEGKLHTGVFVWRSDMPRFISVRRSNNGEEKRYCIAG